MLLLGRIRPFLRLIHRDSPKGQEIAWEAQPKEYSEWHARVMAVGIPLFLATQSYKTGKSVDAEVIFLDKWRRFPTPHCQVEFIDLVEWFALNAPEYHSPYAEWKESEIARLRDGIYSVGLILEAHYYLNEYPKLNRGPGVLCGCLDEAREHISYTYLEELNHYFEAEQKRKAGIVPPLE